MKKKTTEQIKAAEFKNVFLLEEGLAPPSLNTISKIDIGFSVGSGFKFDPTQQYGAWVECKEAMDIWELFEYMRMIIPEEKRLCVKVIIKEKNDPDCSTIGWVYTPKVKS